MYADTLDPLGMFVRIGKYTTNFASNVEPTLVLLHARLCAKYGHGNITVRPDLYYK